MVDGSKVLSSPINPLAGFQPLNDADWPTDVMRLRDGFAGQLNVYRVMAHNPALLAAWETLRNHVVRENALPLDRLELVILRAGYRANAEYEWAHHVVRGRAAGLSDERIRAAAQPRLADDLSGDQLMLRAVDELVDEGMLSPAAIAALMAEFGQRGVLDLIATVGMYKTLAFILLSFATPIDDDIGEALAHRPL
ncbi:carboxymuconolactone decarboxylase family protein [Sphingobium sp. MK2]|uniref:carboxymuconolactone decarboxylase family protein n=1 Tax=Sphingobium sp. MK2 TaxID=3116540 RepID=UPI0032E35AAE